MPFNFPAMVPFWFLPYAIACGNAYMLKPSEQVPMTQALMWEIMDDVGGLPPGVINLVNGSVDVVNAHARLARHRRHLVRRLGQDRQVRLRAARPSNGKRVQALGGAKNHMVVMPDALMDKTADNIIGSAFGAAGQRCMAGSVIVTVGDAKGPLFDAAAEAHRGAHRRRRHGGGLRRRPARLDHRARPHHRAGSTRASRRARRCAVDGRQAGRDPDGAFVGPTIIDGVTPDMEVAQEEIFGPVLSVIHADSLEDAIEIVNSQPLRQRHVDLHRVRRGRPQVPRTTSRSA